MFDRLLDLAARYRKAIIGFVTPGIIILGGPMTQGHAPATADWWTAAGTMLLTGVGVAAISNKPKQ